jgi:D-beta-D-heptose 7-phosphate kinase/D-beta-D-heptose 1-phosphate adenosyltransferase
MTASLEAQFHNIAVLIAGDVMLDEYIIGSVSRISPEAPVPVLDVHSRKHIAGGAANVAANVASLGAKATLAGLAALDSAGLMLRELLKASGIESALVDSRERCTICKTRIVAGRQQVVRIDHEERAPFAIELIDDACAAVCDRVRDGEVVILSDYAKGLLTEVFCKAVIAEARRCNRPIIVDPKGQDFRKYAGCTVITPNLGEASRAANMEIHSEADVNRAGDALKVLLPGTAILITRGADGMTLFRENHSPLTVPTVARQVYDVVGAGDTVVATLAVALGAGFDLPGAMHIANVAAGVVVDKPGTATVTVAEILAHSAIESRPIS